MASDTQKSILAELVEPEDEHEEQKYIDQLAQNKAEEVYKKFAINEKIANQKAVSIGPINTIPLKKKQRQEERRLTAGKGWFNMPIQELSEEMKDAVRAIQLRSYVNPKKFFKKNELTKFPKYFQVGTIVSGPTDFKDKQLTKRERKQNIADELLAEDEQVAYSKAKFKEVQAEREELSKKKMILKKSIKKNRTKRRKDKVRK